MAEIKCSVNSCHYWDNGNICTAKSIMVKNTLEQDMDDEFSPDMEVGHISPDPETDDRNLDAEMARLDPKVDRKADDMGKKALAKRSSDTCCETFREKNKEKF